MAVIKSNTYKVVVAKNTFKALSTFLAKKKYSSFFILCDENTLQHCLPILITSCSQLSDAQIIEIESGESSKSLEFSAHILQTLIENDADKNTLLINLGGGVVSDLGGFVASIYKRGIDFINIPTSLLAMADASIGGKTGIDFNGIKNSIGTFTQPKGVFVNSTFLKTLDIRHLKNGLVEVYKIAMVADAKFWNDLPSLIHKNAYEPLMTKSIYLKNTIVLKDPFDKGIRKILNFGHTIGHALESILLSRQSDILHGEAVAAGMLIESHIALQKKLLQKNDFINISKNLQATFDLISIQNISDSSILELIKNDKKTTKNKFLFALPTKIGACKFDVEVNETQIKKAIAYYNTSLK